MIVYPRELTVYEGATITLKCNVTGNPQPTIRWTKGNGSNAALSSQNTLTMLKVNQTASGTYHCTASNGIGSPDTRSVLVTVRSESFLFYLPRNFSIISRYGHGKLRKLLIPSSWKYLCFNFHGSNSISQKKAAKLWTDNFQIDFNFERCFVEFLSSKLQENGLH